jgi:hypothetical protein
MCLVAWIILRDTARKQESAAQEMLRINRAIPLCCASFLVLLHCFPTLEAWMELLTVAALPQILLWIVMIALSSAIVLILSEMAMSGKTLAQLASGYLLKKLASVYPPESSGQLQTMPLVYQAPRPAERLRTSCLLFLMSLLPGSIAFVLLYPGALEHLNVLGILLMGWIVLMQGLILPGWRVWRCRKAILNQCKQLLTADM